jgi:hypothetical protein
MPYRIEYSPLTIPHLLAMTARQRALVCDAVDSSYPISLPSKRGIES